MGLKLQARVWETAIVGYPYLAESYSAVPARWEEGICES